MRIRIVGRDLPGRSWGPGPYFPDGHPNVHVAVQRRGKPHELLDLVRADAETATWMLECTDADTSDGVDLKGPYIQGPTDGRFVYLSWGIVDEAGCFTMFRRAKLWLDAVPPNVLRRARQSGTLVGRLGLTDAAGGPVCASVRPPAIEWSAGTD